MLINSNLSAVKKYLQKVFISADLQLKPVSIDGKTAALIVFTESITNKELIGKSVIQPLSAYNGKITVKNIDNLILNPDKKVISEMTVAVKEVLSGNAMLFVDGLNKAFSISAKKFEMRAVSEPPTATVVKGPREGFVEDIETNISLLRRKLKTTKLVFKKTQVGKYSDTTVAVCYIDGVVQKGLVEKIVKRLKTIQIDAVLDSSYITEFLGEHPTSLFKQLGNTEKPDIFTSKILEGRVGIIVDGSPIAITCPYVLLEDLQSAEDYYVAPYKATMSRVIRVFSIGLSLLLPAFFVAAQLFHLQLIPLPFLLTIVGSIKGIPLSPSYEMIFTLLIFEVLNEASVRMPKYVGMVVSIVGGLVLGETAVNAGIISAPALMIIALSGICLYTVPELERQFSVLRAVFLLIAGSVGGYGLLLAIATLIVYLTSFETYGTPVLAPFAPLNVPDMQDGVVKEFMLESTHRPNVFKSPNKIRLKKNKDIEE